MCEIIMTFTNHHMLILSTARQHCVRTVTGFLSTECGSDCHEQEVLEIIVVLICIYINWSRVLSLHTLEAYLHLFLISALDGGQWATSHLGILFFVGRSPAMGGGVGPRTSLVASEGEKTLLRGCKSNSSSLVQLIAYFSVILGTQNWNTTISKLFYKLGELHWQFSLGFERRAGSDSEAVAALQMWKNLIVGRDVRIVISSVLRLFWGPPT
jgi:hypothetical protein